ncbi:MAG: hypothetical protein AAFY66_02790 [Pseudomonadota bacterium]
MTDSSIIHSSVKAGTRPGLKRLLETLRNHLLEAKARSVIRNLPDRLLRDAGLTLREGWLLGDHDSRDVATRLEIEHLRRRLF